MSPLFLAVQLYLLSQVARAADPEPTATPAETQVAAPATDSGEDGAEASPPPQQKKRTSKGRRGGDHKETEGTTAPNRFEADTVIKSQYKLDGEPLEVDPD